MPQSIQKEVIIIGAGAAGLMCALTAAQAGRSVLLLDHAPAPGKKILISGGGRCNFTNLNVGAEHYLSQNPHFCKSALSRFGSENFIDLVKKHKISYYEKTAGQLFCTESAREILKMLLSECRKGQVEMKMPCRIESIEKLTKEQGFRLKTASGDFLCTSLVIATGGLSYPKIGASTFGYECARKFGLNVLPCRPALVALHLNAPDLKKIKGLSGSATPVSVTCDGQTFYESMLMTHKGLSGPAILQISNYWHPGAALTINLLPDIDLSEDIAAWQKYRPDATLKTLLSEKLTKRLAAQWLALIAENKAVKHYRPQEVKSIAAHFQAWTLSPSGTSGYRLAEVTAGGVDTDGLSSKSFECKSVPGLYFIGEVLDVTGWLGGYNFQWAWSSGYCAGLAV